MQASASTCLLSRIRVARGVCVCSIDKATKKKKNSNYIIRKHNDDVVGKLRHRKIGDNRTAERAASERCRRIGQRRRHEYHRVLNQGKNEKASWNGIVRKPDRHKVIHEQHVSLPMCGDRRGDSRSVRSAATPTRLRDRQTTTTKTRAIFVS